MHAHAITPRPAADSAHDPLAAVLGAVRQTARPARHDLMPALLQYWQALARHDLPTRRGWFAASRTSVRTGATSPQVFAVFALGDNDESIVFDAVAEFIGTHPVSVERRQAAVDGAIDWIRRGLALNRSAVFAALLSFGEAAIEEALAGLRLVLTHAEIEAVCRAAAARPARTTRAFLVDWLELLAAAVEPDTQAQRAVADAVASLGR